MRGTYTRLVNGLYAPVDNASLVLFRLAFGLLMLWNVVRYIVVGRISAYYVDPTFHFKYLGFEWVAPLPETWMHVLFVLMAVLCLCIAIGLFYRVSAVLFCLVFTYVFLLDQSRYLNHYYLICLLSLLMVFVPAHRAVSVDVLRRPELRCRHAPAWSVWLLRAQLGIIYFYAGVAKLNGDWLRGEPMRMWLRDRVDRYPTVGWLFTEEWFVYSFSYGGLLFDLAVVPLLLWRKTRRYAFAGAVLFHFMNAELFQIGVFPWMMIAITTIFFKPSWPRRFLGLEPVSAVMARPQARPLWLGVLALYVLSQALLPLRHFLYPGNVSWTEEAHAFAWHMKLRDKESSLVLVATDRVAGKVWRIDLKDPNSDTRLVPPTELTKRQRDKMSGRPDMILQYAHHIARRLRGQTGHDIEVRARARSSLNGRPYQVLIDPTVDLVKQRRSLWPATWIMPLNPRNQR